MLHRLSETDVLVGGKVELVDDVRNANPAQLAVRRRGGARGDLSGVRDDGGRVVSGGAGRDGRGEGHRPTIDGKGNTHVIHSSYVVDHTTSLI